MRLPWSILCRLVCRSRHGKTWPSHRVISDRVGFNYTSIREPSPGRLLYLHYAPKSNAVYVEVERIKP